MNESRDGKKGKQEKKSFADWAEQDRELQKFEPKKRPPPQTPPPGTSTEARSKRPSETSRGKELLFPDPDERRLARRSDVRVRIFSQLKAGRIKPEKEIDLHGFHLKQGREKLIRELGQAFSQGMRCVLVIHGKGTNSLDGIAILKAEVPDWLAEKILEQKVAAFAPAQEEHGGQGALYILLQ